MNAVFHQEGPLCGNATQEKGASCLLRWARSYFGVTVIAGGISLGQQSVIDSIPRRNGQEFYVRSRRSIGRERARIFPALQCHVDTRYFFGCADGGSNPFSRRYTESVA